jgi:hypothetical protein
MQSLQLTGDVAEARKKQRAEVKMRCAEAKMKCAEAKMKRAGERTQ